jgi:IS30 family transposase
MLSANLATLEQIGFHRIDILLWLFVLPHFPQPNSLWHCPTNEYTKGLIRQYLPKGIDMSIYSQTDINKIAASRSTRPEKLPYSAINL